MEFDDTIFKPYDIRGIAPDQINPDIAYHIGNALVAFLNPTTIAVGRGTGKQTGEICDAVIRGINDAGSDITDLGEITPDALHYVVGKYDLDGGIMIAPGRRDADEIEIKICRKQAMPLSGRGDLDQIRAALDNNTVKISPNRGNTARKNILPEFVEHCLARIDRDAVEPLRMVIDTHGGAAAGVIPSILEKLSVKFDYELINTPIGSENGTLISKLAEKSADCGIEFDPAGGRMALYDSKGRLLPGDILTALIAGHLLDKNHGETVLYSLICSRAVPELIEQKGGIAVKTRVGPSLVRPMMKKHNALFGGEPSGYFYYRDHWFADSGIITFLTCLEILSRNEKPLNEMITDLDKYHRSGEITFRVSSAREKIELVAKKYSTGTQDRLDGLSVDTGDFRFNIRLSNTEPAVRLNVEATGREILDRVVKEIKDICSS